MSWSVSGNTSDKRRLLLVGGGGHCRSVLSSLLAAGELVAGIIDREEKIGEKIFEVHIIGTDESLSALADKGYEAIITVGSVKDNRARAELFEKTRNGGFRMASFVARTAIIARDVSIGEGTVVLEGAVVNTGARIGDNCIVNTGAIVEHDVVIGDNVHVATGARIGGGVKVGDLAFIGSGSTVIQGIEIGPASVVGAGSVLVNNLPGGSLAVGSPAKIREEVNR